MKLRTQLIVLGILIAVVFGFDLIGRFIETLRSSVTPAIIAKDIGNINK